MAPGYLAMAVKFDDLGYSDESLVDAQRKLEEVLERSSQYPSNSRVRPFLNSLGLRARVALLSIISIAKPLEHAHWNYRTQPVSQTDRSEINEESYPRGSDTTNAHPKGSGNPFRTH